MHPYKKFLGRDGYDVVVRIRWSLMERFTLNILARRGDKHTPEDPLDHHVLLGLTEKDRLSWDPDKEARLMKEETEVSDFTDLIKDLDGDLARLLDGRIRHQDLGEIMIKNSDGSPLKKHCYVVPPFLDKERKKMNSGEGEVVAEVTIQPHILGRVLADCIASAQPRSKIVEYRHKARKKDRMSLTLVRGGKISRISKQDEQLLGPNDFVLASVQLEADRGSVYAIGPITFVLLPLRLGSMVHKFMNDAESRFRSAIDTYCEIVPRKEKGERFQGLRMDLGERSAEPVEEEAADETESSGEASDGQDVAVAAAGDSTTNT